MRYCLAIVVLGLLLVPSSVRAQDLDAAGVPIASPGVNTLALPSNERLLALTADYTEEAQVIERAFDRPDPRRAVLSSLHLVTGIVQGYDGLLTLKVLNAGGVEKNPLIAPLGTSQGAMIGVKVAAAVATVLGTETLWRSHHRVGAIVASIAANSAMAIVAHHNSRVLARLQGR